MATLEERASYHKTIRGAMGDDLERVKMAFGNLSEPELDQQYGQSGQTCREILASYQEQRDRWTAANKYLEALMAQKEEYRG